MSLPLMANSKKYIQPYSRISINSHSDIRHATQNTIPNENTTKMIRPACRKECIVESQLTKHGKRPKCAPTYWGGAAPILCINAECRKVFASARDMGNHIRHHCGYPENECHRIAIEGGSFEEHTTASECRRYAIVSGRNPLWPTHNAMEIPSIQLPTRSKQMESGIRPHNRNAPLPIQINKWAMGYTIPRTK